MMRRVLLLFVLVAGISLVFWSGYQNHKRRSAELSPQNRATLVPDTSTASSDSPIAASPMRGKRAPAFNLVDLSGKKVSLSDFQGHPLVVNFWGTYCLPCKLEMPWLEEFSHKYAANGFKVIGVTYDAEVGVPVISKDVNKLGVTYPILLSTPQAEKDYLSDSEVLPMSFYIDKTGKIVEVTASLGSKDQLESMVKETIAAN